ncbi:acyl-CoA dehydrogenase family protein [Streptosporangium sp. NPDC000563]|uniref:acyl-CoA dehydrogenase family protein n=1 Tax=unclassified Streptosporangium TaxID=2632669 RepID=UPI0033224E27
MTLAFEFSPELQRYERELKEWSVARIRPHARQADTDHRPPANYREIFETCPVKISKHVAKGRDNDLPKFPDGELMRVMAQYEGLNYGDTWAQSYVSGGIGHVVVSLLGTPEQIDRWYEPVVRGGGVTGFGLSEPGAGSDTSGLVTRAVRDGDSWVINGSKIFCSHAASAEYVVAFAVTDPEKGIASAEAFVIERGTPGLVILKENEDKLGLRAWETTQIGLEDCVVPLGNRLGHDPSAGANGAGGARLSALSVLNQNRPNVSALSTTVAQAALDLTGELLHEQRLGFRADRWSLIQRELEGMAAALTRNRHLNRYAQWMRQHDLQNRVEASMAKAFGPPTSERVVRRCMQLLGPEGTSTELLLEKWYRDLKILDIFEGTGQIQRVIVAKDFAKKARG